MFSNAFISQELHAYVICIADIKVYFVAKSSLKIKIRDL